jgi:hypothetical protein
MSFIGKLRGGASVSLGPQQLSWARLVAQEAARVTGGHRGALIAALITVGVETGFRMYANRGNPRSLQLPHDAVGQDHDSVGLFQQRPASGWGTTDQLMTVAYSTRAFLGGAHGPNQGDPRGLLDIPGWETMPLGRAAQAVQVSAFPDRYEQWVPVAEALVDRFGILRRVDDDPPPRHEFRSWPGGG